jgi:hypothetical protein
MTQPQGFKAPTVMTESDANLLSVADGSPCQIDCSGGLAAIKHSDEVVKEEVAFLSSASANQWRSPAGTVTTVELTKQISSQIAAQIGSSPGGSNMSAAAVMQAASAAAAAAAALTPMADVKGMQATASLMTAGSSTASPIGATSTPQQPVARLPCATIFDPVI